MLLKTLFNLIFAVSLPVLISALPSSTSTTGFEDTECRPIPSSINFGNVSALREIFPLHKVKESNTTVLAHLLPRIMEKRIDLSKFALQLRKESPIIWMFLIALKSLFILFDKAVFQPIHQVAVAPVANALDKSWANDEGVLGLRGFDVDIFGKHLKEESLMIGVCFLILRKILLIQFIIMENLVLRPIDNLVINPLKKAYDNAKIE